MFDRWADALCDTFILGIKRYYCPYKDCSAPLEYNEGKVIQESECLQYVDLLSATTAPRVTEHYCNNCKSRTRVNPSCFTKDWFDEE
ncbi:hypothetical protein Sjap_012004 [Stephania japonica]|uniref:Uncharacterized protein n=1 Tax=Stephania japonica TaxID=461633 RepID=A0AAP0JC76_9MAGN